MNSKVQLGIKVVLILLSAYLTTRIYKSIMQPIKFQRIERVRLSDVTEQLENIREAQLAYKSENGGFCSSIIELVGFVDTGKDTLPPGPPKQTGLRRQVQPGTRVGHVNEFTGIEVHQRLDQSHVGRGPLRFLQQLYKTANMVILDVEL